MARWYRLLFFIVCNPKCKGEVYCGRGSVFFVITSGVRYFKIISYAFLRIDSESSAQKPLRCDFLRTYDQISCVHADFEKSTFTHSIYIVRCVYNFLLRYSGTRTLECENLLLYWLDIRYLDS